MPAMTCNQRVSRLSQSVAYALLAHDDVRRGGRAEQHVDFGKRAPRRVVVHGGRSVERGERLRALEGAVGDDRRAHALRLQRGERQLRHLSAPSTIARLPAREPKIFFASCTAAELTLIAP